MPTGELHTTQEMPPATSATSDAALVLAARRGDREAFAQIVERHLVLVSAIACAGVADVEYGEHLAEEAFLEAWRSLAHLKDPAKLRPWLSGLVRSLVQQAHQDTGQSFASADDARDAGHPELSHAEEAALAEERALLGRALDAIPEAYREPLVLAAWEESMARVAAALGLTEDAVRQRLARARALIEPGIVARVEACLGRVRPDRAFKLAVLAALPPGMPDTAVAPSGATAPMTAVIGSGAVAEPIVPYSPPYAPLAQDLSPRAVLYAHAGLLGLIVWILPMCWLAGDAFVACAVIASSAGAYGAAVWATLREPGRYFRFAFWQGLATSLLLLAVVNLRWDDWMDAYRETRWYDAKGDLPLWLVNLALVAFVAEVLRKLLTQDRLRRPR